MDLRETPKPGRSADEIGGAGLARAGEALRGLAPILVQGHERQRSSSISRPSEVDHVAESAVRHQHPPKTVPFPVWLDSRDDSAGMQEAIARPLQGQGC
jgi:hypothetical protein